jgi:uncharacterized protein YraI
MHFRSPARLHARLVLFGLLLACVPPAAAQTAFTTQSVNLRSGPDRAFPLVTWLPPNTRTRVWGCVSGWRWCDISAGRHRGWVSARYLSGPVRGRAPVVTFSVGSYWGAHYRSQPWFGSQQAWVGWGSPGFRPPPPPPPRRPPSRPR